MSLWAQAVLTVSPLERWRSWPWQACGEGCESSWGRRLRGRSVARLWACGTQPALLTPWRPALPPRWSARRWGAHCGGRGPEHTCCTHAHALTHMYTHALTHALTLTHIMHRLMHMHTHVCAHTHTHKHTCTHSCTSAHTHTHTGTRAHTCTGTHTRMHTKQSQLT